MIIRGAQDFAELTGYDVRGAKLITIDSENVLTRYGEPEIRAEALARIDSLSKLAYLAVATNNKDEVYIGRLSEQLPSDIPVLSAISYKNKKTSGEMFLAAVSVFGVDPSESMHIDDQVLSLAGARMAKFGYGTLVRPYGTNHHNGVRMGRVLDVTTRKALVLFQGIIELTQSEMDTKG